MLILVALIGGELVLGLGWLIKKTCGVEIRLPPLLGMLIVGIILKNVPYNFGQFGRAECTIDKYGVHHNATGFHDSIHELDLEIIKEKTEDSSFRRRRAHQNQTFHPTLMETKCLRSRSRCGLLKRQSCK